MKKKIIFTIMIVILISVIAISLASCKPKAEESKTEPLSVTLSEDAYLSASSTVDETLQYFQARGYNAKFYDGGGEILPGTGIIINQDDENILSVISIIFEENQLYIIRLKDEETAKAYAIGYDSRVHDNYAYNFAGVKRIGSDVYVGRIWMLLHVAPSNAEKYLINAFKEANKYADGADLLDRFAKDGVELQNFIIKNGSHYRSLFNKYSENNKFEQFDKMYKRVTGLETVSYEEKDIYAFANSIQKFYEMELTSGKNISIFEFKDEDSANWFNEKILTPAKASHKKLVFFNEGAQFFEHPEWNEALLDKQEDFTRVYNEIIEAELSKFLLKNLDESYSDIEIKVEENFVVTSYTFIPFEKDFERESNHEYKKLIKIFDAPRFKTTDWWWELPDALKNVAAGDKIVFDNGPEKVLYVFYPRGPRLQGALKEQFNAWYDVWLAAKPEEERETFDKYVSDDEWYFVAGDKDLLDMFKSQKAMKRYKITYDFNGVEKDDIEVNLVDKNYIFTEFDVDYPIKVLATDGKVFEGWEIKKADGTYEAIEKLNGEDLVRDYPNGITLRAIWSEPEPEPEPPLP